MADKDVLKKMLTKIHGQVTRDWTEQSTHLCMNSITVTEKVNRFKHCHDMYMYQQPQAISVYNQNVLLKYNMLNNNNIIVYD